MNTVQALRDLLTINLFSLFFLLFLVLTAIMRQERKLAKKEKEICDMRVEILTAQISQHFIYNTLTTIKCLCKKDAALAAETVDEFAGYLRGNLDALTGEKMIPFSKEIGHVKNFLAIEQKRFGKRISVVYDIQEDSFMLPALTLQPIVENAVRHGIIPKEQGGTIRISTGKNGTDHWVRVEDDGIGYPAGKKAKGGGTHVGMRNVTSRVERLCGGTVTVWSSLGYGTEVLVKIPWEK